jgi:HK97 family phage prohead protease
MKLKHISVPFEVKEVSDDGTFTGYGSVFGVKDSYDEIVVPGAFVESIEQRKPALLWQHRSGEPIGVYEEVKEDSVGLHLKGRLALKTTRGAEAYELLRMNALSGLSIGFMTREDSFDQKTGIRTLKKVDLWEVSLVTFPANDAARITGVKGISEITTLSEVEDCLRDAGFTKSEALALVARVKAIARSDSEAGESVALLENVRSLLKITPRG